jgi:hypothetical protein
MNNEARSLKNIRVIVILSIATVLLLLPLIAMQFDTGVDWKPVDFTIAAVLLYGTGLCCELVLRKVKSVKYRFLICSVILAVLFLVWAELAVGLFGTPLAGS